MRKQFLKPGDRRFAAPTPGEYRGFGLWATRRRRLISSLKDDVAPRGVFLPRAAWRATMPERRAERPRALHLANEISANGSRGGLRRGRCARTPRRTSAALRPDARRSRLPQPRVRSAARRAPRRRVQTPGGAAPTLQHGFRRDVACPPYDPTLRRPHGAARDAAAPQAASNVYAAGDARACSARPRRPLTGKRPHEIDAGARRRSPLPRRRAPRGGGPRRWTAAHLARLGAVCRASPATSVEQLRLRFRPYPRPRRFRARHRRAAAARAAKAEPIEEGQRWRGRTSDPV